MNPYRKIFNALAKAKIEYLIVGGVAVNLYGYSRFTGDVDILLALDEENLKKMSALMKRLGYVERLPVSIFELQDKKKIQKWMKEKGLTAYTFISKTKPQLDIDILVDKSLVFSKYLNKRALIETWGLKLPVVSLNKPKQKNFNTDYLKRSAASTPEQRLDWLAAALEFAQAKKKIIKK